MAQQRRQREIEERYQSFRQSREFKALRRRGLKALGKGKLLDGEEWWIEARSQGAMKSEEYANFREEAQQVGVRFGLSVYAVELACLLRGYNPQRYPYVLEDPWIRVFVLTKIDDELWLRWLAYRVWELNRDGSASPLSGLVDPEVVLESGPRQESIVFIPSPTQPDQVILPADLPPWPTAFRLMLDFPPDYPPDGSAELGRRSAQFGRELARRMGYKIAQRSRSSSLSSKAKQLRVDEGRLPPGAAYGIADQLYGEQDASQD